MHAKVSVSDDVIASVGSVNMDYRSLYLHFECGCLLYDCPCIQDIKGRLFGYPAKMPSSAFGGMQGRVFAPAHPAGASFICPPALRRFTGAPPPATLRSQGCSHALPVAACCHRKKPPNFGGFCYALLHYSSMGLKPENRSAKGGGGLLYRRQIIIRILPTRTTLPALARGGALRTLYPLGTLAALATLLLLTGPSLVGPQHAVPRAPGQCAPARHARQPAARRSRDSPPR